MSKTINPDWPTGAHASVGKRGEAILFAIMRCVDEFGEPVFGMPQTAAQIRYKVELFGGFSIPFDDRHLSELLAKAGVQRVCGKDRRWRYLLCERHDAVPGELAREWKPEGGGHDGTPGDPAQEWMPQASMQVKPCRPVKGAKSHASMSIKAQRILARLRFWIAENASRIPEWVTAREIKEMGFDCSWKDSHFSELLQKGRYQGKVRPGGGVKVFALLKPLVEPGEQQTRDQMRAAKEIIGHCAPKVKLPPDPRYHGRKSVDGCPDMNTQGRGAGGHASLGPKGKADIPTIERFIEKNREQLKRAGFLTIKQLREMGLQTLTDNSHLSELLSKLGYPSIMDRACDPRRFNLLGEKGEQYTREQLRELCRQQSGGSKLDALRAFYRSLKVA